MIIQLLASSLAVSLQANPAEIQILSAQGRASEVHRVERLAKRCGVKDPLVSYVRGAEIFHHPAEPGAELFITADDVTADARDCLRKGVPLLRRRLKTVTLDSDAL